jgi:hypothetical protein
MNRANRKPLMMTVVLGVAAAASADDGHDASDDPPTAPASAVDRHVEEFRTPRAPADRRCCSTTPPTCSTTHQS